MSSAARTLHLHTDVCHLLDSLTARDESAVAAFDAAVSRHPPRLEVEVLSIKRVPAGAGVSYGHTHVTRAETTLALVSVGYGHGIPRKAGNRSSVTWAPGTRASGTSRQTAHRLPIVGRVAMDVLVVDAGDHPVAAGDTVVVFGDPAASEIAITDWADGVNERPAVLLACLNRVAKGSVR